MSLSSNTFWVAKTSGSSISVKAPVNGIQSDLIRFTDISDCQYADLLDEFPSRRLEIDDYDKSPYIQNLGYDGYFLFSLVSYTRNDGYGHLYLYNTNQHRADSKVNPVKGNCCYRDPQFSPDGRYFIFAYQPYEVGATTDLYLVPFAALGTGGNMEPLKGRLDFEFETLQQELIKEIEEKINVEVGNARPVRNRTIARSEAETIPDLIRTKINLLPKGIQQVRVVEIDGLDLQADGGTHVRNTSEVGTIRVVDYKSKGKINKRIYLELDP